VSKCSVPLSSPQLLSTYCVQTPAAEEGSGSLGPGKRLMSCKATSTCRMSVSDQDGYRARRVCHPAESLWVASKGLFELQP
jgi:hypothetical protein